LSKGSRSRFEDRLGDVVVVAAVRDRHVEIHPGIRAKGLEKLLNQFNRKLPDRLSRKLHLEHERRPTRKIDGYLGKALIHRHDRPAIAIDATLIAKRFFEGLADHDSHVFNGVVVIDLQIPLGFNVQIDQAVTRQQVQHVVKESDSGMNRSVPRAVQVQRHPNLGLLRLAVNRGRTAVVTALTHIGIVGISRRFAKPPGATP